MDFQSAMETFAEAWVAANTQTPLTEAAVEAQGVLGNQVTTGTAHHNGPTMTLQDLSERREHVQEGSESGGSSGLRSPSSHLPSSSVFGDFRSSHHSRTPLLGPGKALPVHCVVEQTPVQHSSSCSESTQLPIELDSYAIVPTCTLFTELIRTALIKLGYSASEAVGAKGAIQLKNWKPLSFEQITDSSEVTVGEILGDVAAIATLRIRLSSRPKMNVTFDVKEKLLQVLLVQSQNLLTTSGCPIDQSILLALSKGRLECDISEETRKKFDHWYLQQVFQHCRQVALLHKQNMHQQQQTRINHLDQLPIDGAAVISNKHHHVHGHGAVFTSPPQGRTRIRTSFDPELELPKLQRWFAENQHPSRHQIQQYVKELNALESRRGRKPLDINNVVYWFKNARAAYKRAEQRYFVDPNGSRSPSGDYCEDSNPHEADNSTSDGYYKNSVDCSKQRKIDFCSPKNGFKMDLQGSDKENPDNIDHTLDLSVRRETTDTNSASGQSVQRDLVDMNNSIGQSVRQEITDTNNNSGDHSSNVSPSHHKRMEQAEVKEELPEDITDNSIDSCVSGDEDQDIDVTMITSESWEKSERNKTPRESLSHQDFENRDTTSSGPSHQMTPSASVSPYNMEERRKRNRTFIDPVTEVPRLEQWFSINTHPSHSMIVRFTHELNVMPYRQKFPKLEPKNIQFWFKNRRAKCKRLSLAAVKDSGPTMDRLAFQPLR